MNIKGRGCFWF